MYISKAERNHQRGECYNGKYPKGVKNLERIAKKWVWKQSVCTVIGSFCCRYLDLLHICNVSWVDSSLLLGSMGASWDLMLIGPWKVFISNILVMQQLGTLLTSKISSVMILRLDRHLWHGMRELDLCCAPRCQQWISEIIGWFWPFCEE